MACEHELVAEFGGRGPTTTPARSSASTSSTPPPCCATVAASTSSRTTIVERLLDGVIARVREHVPWRPGARRLLTELNAAGVPCALVTMSWRRLVDAIVDALAPITFDAVVTGDEVTPRQAAPRAVPAGRRRPRRRPGGVRRHRGLADRCRLGRRRRLRRRRRAQPRRHRAGAGAGHRPHAEGRLRRRPRRATSPPPRRRTSSRRRAVGRRCGAAARWPLVVGAGRARRSSSSR